MSAEAERDRIARELAQEQLGDPYEYQDVAGEAARRRRAVDELARLTGELGLYDVPSQCYEDTDAAGEPRVVRHEQD